MPQTRESLVSLGSPRTGGVVESGPCSFQKAQQRVGSGIPSCALFSGVFSLFLFGEFPGVIFFPGVFFQLLGCCFYVFFGCWTASIVALKD